MMRVTMPMTNTPTPPAHRPLTRAERRVWDVVAPKFARRGLIDDDSRRWGLVLFIKAYVMYGAAHHDWQRAVRYSSGGATLRALCADVEEWRRFLRQSAIDDWALPLQPLARLTADGFDAELRRWFEESGVNDGVNGPSATATTGGAPR
jgi:hypothetical protein